MGCCIPKSFRGINNSYVDKIRMYDSEKTNLVSIENFDIEKSLLMFGQDKKLDNFILTFDFNRKNFDQIKVPNECNY